MNDYQNTPTSDGVDEDLQKTRPKFQRVSSLRYSADPCRDEMETRGPHITCEKVQQLVNFVVQIRWQYNVDFFALKLSWL